MTFYNPNVDIIYVNVYTNFGCIMSIGPQDIERNWNFNINEGL